VSISETGSGGQCKVSWLTSLRIAFSGDSAKDLHAVRTDAEQRQLENTMSTTTSHDPKLLDLKRVAEAGSDEGPQFDNGVQSVIKEIEDKEFFVHSRFASLILASAHECTQNPGTELPVAVQEFLDAYGWIIEQGVQFARGVEYAEDELWKYRVVKNDED
jgi:hypothetical protein